MASNRIKGVTIEIDGDTSKLTDSLKKVDGQLKTTQGNLRDINKLLKLDPGNTDLLVQKQKNLATAIKSTQDRLTELKKVQQSSVSPEEWDKIQREIVETETNLKGLKREMSDFGSVAAQKLKVVGEKMQAVGQKVSSVGSSLTSHLTVPIAAAFTAAGKSASDYEENLNKIDVAFGKQSKGVKEWAKTATKQFGLSKVAATEAAAGFGALSKGIGLSEKSAADVSTTLAGLSSDLASYFNTGTDVSAKALEGIFTGESEALKKFGVVMTETNLSKFAADHGKVWKEASQSEKVMIRYQYVLEKTKDAQGDYSRTSDGTANSFRTFQAVLQNLATTIGQRLLPIITPIVQKITDIVDSFSKLSPQTQDMIVKIGLIAAALGPVLKVVGHIISLTGTALTKIPKLVSGANTLVTSLQGLSGVLGTGGPVILAIAAAIAAGVLIYKNWDKIKDAAKKLGDGIKDTFSRLKTNVVNNWNNIKTTTAKAWEKVKTSASTAANGVKTAVTGAWNSIKTGTTTAFNSIKTTASTAWSTIKTNAGTAWSGISSTVTGAANSLKTNATNVLNGFKTSVSGVWNTIKTSTGTAWDGVKNAITSRLESAKTAVSGIMSRLRTTIANGFSGLAHSIGNPFAGLTNFASNAISRISSIFRGAHLSLPKIKMPHFRVSWNEYGPIKLPRVSVDWYKKAYDNAVMFSQPTVLQTPQGYKGFGDGSGPEIVMGLNKLRELVGSTSGNTTINVYAQPGMNVKQLATEIQNRLAAVERQKQRVYA